MLSDFFQIGSVPSNAMHGYYDTRLVILSFLVATFASYIALDITGRLRDRTNTRASNMMWLCGGSFAMGAGIWSMHFIGMLAFSIPMMSMSYDPAWTGLSMLVAIFASGFALFLLKEEVPNIKRLALGGIILGLAIASMHYVGMEAMKITMSIHYYPNLFFLSILIAIIASEAAILLALKSNTVATKMRFRLKIISAFIMGAAICGMHYTGMAAAVFTMNDMSAHNINPLNTEILAISIAGVTFVILGIAFFVSMYKEAINQQLLATARQAGMAEVATTVLHNVGNVLNSVNISAAIIIEKIEHSKLDNLENLGTLLEENKNNLIAFIQEDPRGKNIINYIKNLSSCWRNEKSLITQEANTLIRNIEHINNIVSMQQAFSTASGIKSIVFVNEILNEALVICGVESKKHEIDVEKDYAALELIQLDKVKLIQILVNLLRNAKDAVIASNNPYKKIVIKTGMIDANKFFIHITDNGVGIIPENITKVFSYGFTTKEKGHGFGLHSSANSASEMGGSIAAKSDGINTGATFILELPCKF